MWAVLLDGDAVEYLESESAAWAWALKHRRDLPGDVEVGWSATEQRGQTYLEWARAQR